MKTFLTIETKGWYQEPDFLIRTFFVSLKSLLIKFFVFASFLRITFEFR